MRYRYTSTLDVCAHMCVGVHSDDLAGGWGDDDRSKDRKNIISRLPPLRPFSRRHVHFAESRSVSQCDATALATFPAAPWKRRRRMTTTTTTTTVITTENGNKEKRYGRFHKNK
ncbi:hypothetical protein QTP88_014399 [Uroleucon formosanum]